MRTLPKMKRVLVPMLLTAVLLIAAVTISLDLSGHVDTHISCDNFIRSRSGGCHTNWGQFLAMLWGLVAAIIGTIWLRYQDSP